MRGAVRIVLLLASFSRMVGAYHLGSGVTHPCHEQLSQTATTHFLQNLPGGARSVPLPKDELWQRVADDLLRLLPEGTDPGRSQPEARFVTLSLLLGVRNPDTGGHSVSSLVALRRNHSDPAPEGQYLHCLRTLEDDGPGADRQVLARTAELLQARLSLAAESLAGAPANQLMPLSLYLEFSGQVTLEVYAPAFLLGEALHILQDSFSHTVRSDDGSEILTVLNFVEAANGSLVEARDGIAHSRALDQCEDQELSALVALAEQTSLAATAALLALTGGDGTLLTQGLSRCPAGEHDPTCGWFSYPTACEQALDDSGTLEGTCCSASDGFCGTRWLAPARTSPTQSLPQDVFGCSLRSGALGGTTGFVGALALALILAGASRRRGRRRGPPVAVHLGLLLTAMGLAPRHAAGSEPEPTPFGPFYLGLELHGSLLAGQPERGLPDVTFGPALRAGLRPHPDRSLALGAFGLIEQSSWVATETHADLTAGVLNLGGGLEVHYFDLLRGSLAIGPSVLLANTVAHSAPQLGLFVDLRPVGLSWNLGRHLRLTLDPLSATWVAPALSAPMIATLRYRLVVGLDWLP